MAKTTEKNSVKQISDNVTESGQNSSEWIPGPRTSAKNVRDPRVRKTVNKLRTGYIELLGEMSPDRISVLKLTDRSHIDRKTFYLHYRNMDDMKNDVCDVKAADLIGRLTGDITQDIRIIYKYLDSLEPGVYSLLTSVQERDFRDRFLHQLFTSEAFNSYYRGDDTDIVEGYLYSIFYIYEENRRSADPLESSELADYAARLVMNGIRGVK